MALMLMIGCSGNNTNKQDQANNQTKQASNISNGKDTKQEQTGKQITIKLLEAEKGWGYKIFVNDRLMINQDNIPAIEGKKGFKTREDAGKIAELMKSKMQKGIMPPTVTKEELDSLEVLEKQPGEFK